PGGPAALRTYLDGQAGGAAAGLSQQPAAGPGPARQAPAAAAEREGGTEFFARVRDRRGAAELVARFGERLEALPDAGGGAQPGVGDAEVVRGGNAAEPARPGGSLGGSGPCVPGAGRLVPAGSVLGRRV